MDSLTDEQLDNIKLSFSMLDSDKSGSVSKKEFCLFLRHLGQICRTQN